jgi:hypothetical protein
VSSTLPPVAPERDASVLAGELRASASSSDSIVGVRVDAPASAGVVAVPRNPALHPAKAPPPVASSTARPAAKPSPFSRF